jgi:hypothetical protein
MALFSAWSALTSNVFQRLAAMERRLCVHCLSKKQCIVYQAVLLTVAAVGFGCC